MFSLVLCLLLATAATNAFLVQRQPLFTGQHRSAALATPASTTAPQTTTEYETRKEELKKVLYREYTTFFDPFEESYYRPEVSFQDPLNNLKGAEKYAGNVGMLGGKTMLGRILFKDAKINLHSVTEPGPRMLRTRWTLSFTFKGLPWQPNPIFTGISDYTLDERGFVVAQRDYWDSIDLKNKRYERSSKQQGLLDFLLQLAPDSGGAASAAEKEMPYELLRRAATYEVRRYPARLVARTAYTTRPEGYERLGAYVGGKNERNVPLQGINPSIIRVGPTSDGGKKTMEWNIAVRFPNGQLVPENVPEPTSSYVALAEEDTVVVGVLRFSDPTTEQFVGYYSKQLREALERDGLVPQQMDKFVIAQYDAIFSLRKRRNEVWLPLEKHDWM